VTYYRNHPERFGELAAQYSNCPSGAVDGSHGQLSRGDCVPEFDDMLFRLDENEPAGRPVETRFGLHIVQVLRRIEGALLPFDTVKSQIAACTSTCRSSWAARISRGSRWKAAQARSCSDVCGL